MSDSIPLRRLLAKQHSHRDWGLSFVRLYTDDGELQCPVCGCDFLRDSVTMLDRKITVFNLKKLQEIDDQSRSRPD